MNSRKRLRLFAAASVATALVISAVGTTLVLAHPGQSAATTAGSVSAKRASVQTVNASTVNLGSLPAATAHSGALAHKSAPFFTAQTLHKSKTASASVLKSAAPSVSASGAANNITSGPKTPSPSTSFQGIQNSANPGGNQGFYFEPPDQAVAASPSFVVQAVNDEIEVFNTSGTKVQGPTGVDSFFKLGSNSCYGSLKEAFLSDPRLLYDPNTQRFFFAMLEVEGTPIGNSCTFLSVYHIAVSQSSDPTKAWNLYTFNMNFGGCTGTTTNCFADYTQLGFDSKGIYYSANMFNDQGTNYDYAEVFGFSKSAAESGSSVTSNGFVDLQAIGGRAVFVDTVQPVATEAPANTPNAELFVNTYNINGDVNGNDCVTTACVGETVWSFANVTGTPTLTGTLVGNTHSYISPPNADEPGCTACVETIDTRITGTPIYKAGYIYAAWGTAVNNGSTVSGIIWSKTRVRLDGTTAANSFQEEGYYFYYGGDNFLSFPAIGVDADSNMFMVFERMGSATNPEVDLVARHATDRSGFFPDGGRTIKKGDAVYDNFNGACSSSNVCRWGDFEATSYDGYATNNVWFCGEYSATGTLANTNWGTWCGKVQYAYGQ